MFASVTTQKHGATDYLLSSVVTRLSDDGIYVLGALRVLAHNGEKQECESTLKLLPDGPDVRITQDLGPESTACRMDASALEHAVGIATSRLAAEGADLIVLNKFGLREAEGHGFRSLIAEAIERGVPVLLGLSNTHRAAFEQFADGMATTLPADEDALVSWCKAAVRSSSATEHIKDMGDPLVDTSERPT